jgi:hypothetical protein
VHFSEHVSTGGLFFDGTDSDQTDGRDINFGLIAKALAATDTPPRVVVLNACDSYTGAEQILESVPVVIAMVDEISDLAGKLFPTKFYAAIASGQSLAAAFQQAQVAMEAATREGAMPELLPRDGVNPIDIQLVTPPEAA